MATNNLIRFIEEGWSVVEKKVEFKRRKVDCGPGVNLRNVSSVYEAFKLVFTDEIKRLLHFMIEVRRCTLVFI